MVIEHAIKPRMAGWEEESTHYLESSLMARDPRLGEYYTKQNILESSRESTRKSQRS